MLRVFDSLDVVYDFRVKNEDTFIPGSQVGSYDGQCFMPIFPNPDGDQTTWYLGNIFMKNYYVAFDMTPYTDNNYRYLQVGIGLQKA